MERQKYYLSSIISVMLLMYMVTITGVVLTYEDPAPVVIEKEVIVYVPAEPEKEQEEVEPVMESRIIEEPEVAYTEPEVIYEEPIIAYSNQELNAYFDITQPTGYSTEDIINMLGSSRSGLHYIADYIVEAEQTYGVNALYLTALFGYESGWGRYQSGNNNIAGWKNINGYFRDFDSVWECVMTVTEGLATSFVPDVGPYLGDVALRYCPDYGYLDTLLQIMYELETNI